MKKNKIILCSITSFMLVFTILLFLFPRTPFTSVVKNKNISSTVQIYGEKTIKQFFQSNMMKLDTLLISVEKDELEETDATFDREISIKVQQNHNTVYEEEHNYSKSDLEKDIKIDLKNLSSSAEDQYQLEIKCNNCTKENPLTLSTANEIEKNEILYLNNELQNKALTMTFLGYKHNYNYAIFFFGCYIISLIVTCVLLIKKKDKHNIYKYLIAEFLVSLLTVCLLFKNLCSYLYEPNMQFLDFFLLIMSLSILTYLFLKILKIKNIKTEQVYLSLIIPIAIAYAIFIIPNYVADEPVHFTRAYDIIDTNIFTTKNKIMISKDFIDYGLGRVSDYSNLKYSLNHATNYQKDKVSFSSAAGYSFILYIFSGFGVWIGKTLSLPIILTFYLARMFNVLVMIIFGYLIIKILPFGKKVALVYLMNPMYIHQGISVSSDSMVNSICLLFIAILLNLRSKEKINNLDFWLLFLSIFLLGFAKYIYLPLILLLCLLIKRRKTLPKKVQIGILIAVILAIGFCAWSLFSMYLIPEANSDPSTVAEGIEEVNMIGQLKYILLHPGYFMKTTLHTLHVMISDYVHMFFGASLGWLNIPVRQYILWPYIFLFFATPFIYDKSDNNILNKQEKVFCNIINLLLVFITILSMWLAWTSIGSSPVLGVQGRYFLPFMMLPLLTLINKDKKIKINNYNNTIICLLLFVHIGVILTIIHYFI